MTRPLVRTARAIYGAIPFRSVRRLAFETFARAVRNRRVVTTIDGLTLDLDLGEVIDLSLYLQKFEPDVTAEILGLTRAGMTVIDIGANIGAHTLLFAKRVGREGRVIAFEPTDFAHAKLLRNLSLNEMPQVTPVKLALSDHRSPARQVDFRASWRTDGSRRDKPSMVAFETLDAWCVEHAVDRVDLVKIDVDGNEYPLLRGSIELLKRDSPLMLMEAVGPHFDTPERNPYALLTEIGYTFRDTRTQEILSLDAMRRRLPVNDPGMTVSFNVVATRKAARS